MFVAARYVINMRFSFSQHLWTTTLMLLKHDCFLDVFIFSLSLGIIYAYDFKY